jgi:hypothetical protein
MISNEDLPEEFIEQQEIEPCIGWLYQNHGGVLVGFPAMITFERNMFAICADKTGQELIEAR